MSASAPTSTEPEPDPGAVWAEQQGLLWVAGVDEAGRGPLAGPVYAAAVVLDPARPIPGLDDSKRLTPRRRAQLAQLIRERVHAYGLGCAEVDEIDSINILQATRQAMARAVAAIGERCDGIVVDGNQSVPVALPQISVVRGDRLCAAVAAASILAKTTRDALMEDLDARYPGYGFARHKGYGTAQHIEALQNLGACPQHRHSFAPVRAVLEVSGG